MIYLRRLSNLVEKIPKKIRYTLIVIDIIILVVLIFDVYGPKYELIAESGYENSNHHSHFPRRQKYHRKLAESHREIEHRSERNRRK